MYDCVIIGAGAAGLMAALTAGQRGRRVLLLDHAEKAGKKILISGGGRCNFTNLGCAPENFLSANPHFAKSALARYTPYDFLEMVERHGIAWHEKTLGQLFCDGSARQIVQMLLDECAAGSVDIRLNCQVTGVGRADHFRVVTTLGEFTSPALILATGGLSIPKMGATGFAHDVARQFGLTLRDLRPGLVPLTFQGETGAMMRGLSGVSLPCSASAGGALFGEAMLFTHRGLSGPAILQVSSYWREGEDIALDILPGVPATEVLLDAKRNRPKAQPATVLGDLLPTRLATELATRHLPPRLMAEMPDVALKQLGDMLNRWPLRPAGSEGYAKAEVTAGGIDTNCLSSRTMEARTVPGLHVIGEAVDVTGWLGGYNFQWAWASGRAAGEAVA